VTLTPGRPTPAPVDWREPWKTPRPRPDGYGRWEQTGRVVGFLLEYDTGSEPLGRVRAVPQIGPLPQAPGRLDHRRLRPGRAVTEQRLQAQFQVGCGEHRVDGAGGQLVRDSEDLVHERAFLGDEREVALDRGAGRRIGRRGLMDPFKNAIDAMLRAERDDPTQRPLTVQRIFDRLGADHGMTDVSYSTVQHYVARRRDEPPPHRVMARRG